MGSFQAREMSEMGLSTDQLLEWHLTSNHYPPYPRPMIAVAKEALERASLGDYVSLIELPAGVSYRGETSIRVNEAVETFHLREFLPENAGGETWQ